MERFKTSLKVVKHVKSNAIVLAKDDMTIGVGAGQMNRVGSAKIAITQAGEKHKVAHLHLMLSSQCQIHWKKQQKQGLQQSFNQASIRDEDSIKVADTYGIAMVFTGVRHFKH